MEKNTFKPEILDRRAQAKNIEYKLNIPKDLFYFNGHFPGHPILPGVVQIKWAIEFAKELGVSGGRIDLKRIKFMRAIQPNTIVWLRLVPSTDNKSLSYRYYDHHGKFASGIIIYSEA